MQRRLEEKISENLQYHGITDVDQLRRRSSSMDENVDEEIVDNSPIEHSDQVIGNKDVCVLEIDDTEDADILESILDRFPPPGIQVYRSSYSLTFTVSKFNARRSNWFVLTRSRFEETRLFEEVRNKNTGTKLLYFEAKKNICVRRFQVTIASRRVI